MPISLILTPFDHFQNMSSGGIGPKLILTLCHRHFIFITRWEPNFDSDQLSQRFSWEFLDRVTPFQLINSALTPLDACLPKYISIAVVSF